MTHSVVVKVCNEEGIEQGEREIIIEDIEFINYFKERKDLTMVVLADGESLILKEYAVNFCCRIQDIGGVEFIKDSEN